MVIDGLYIAGVQRHCIEILKALRHEDIGCTVIALDGGGQWADEFLALAECLIIDVDASLNWCTLQELVHFSKFEFATAHLTAAIEWTAKNVPRTIPRYAHFHSEPSEHELITKEWIDSYCKEFDCIIFPIDGLRRTFAKEFAFKENGRGFERKLKLLPNAIPSSVESTPIKGDECRRGSKSLHVAIVSRIDEDKFSIPLFIETIVNLNRITTNFEVHIAGDGEAIGKLKNAVENANMADKIKHLGFVMDIYKIYEWADVVFLPSKREGMPYVLLECIAFACPLVAPDVGIFQEMKPNGLIFKFGRNDPFEAAQLIQKASSIGREGRKYERELLRSEYMDFGTWSKLLKELYNL